MLICHMEKQVGHFRLQVDLEAGNHVTALFGPSGSGKSLTLQAIAGLITPDRGRIEFGGRVVFDAAARVNVPPRQRRAGYVFQNYALFPHLTVAENIGYGLHRLPRAEREQRVAEAVAMVRLTGLERRRPGHLSGGQQQRVALARALVIRPEILLLDEPFAALDHATRLELHGQLLELLADLPVPTLLVTHQLEEAYALSRTIAVYEAGRIIQAGPREQVYGQPATLGTAGQVGFRNQIPGIVSAVRDGYTYVRGPGFSLVGPASACVPGQPVICAIRPQHVLLVRKDAPARDGGREETCLRGRIVEEIVYGGEVWLWFRPDPAGPDGPPPDLQIALPAHLYTRLGLAAEKRWEVVLRPEFLRLFPGPAPAQWPGVRD